ncbi:hypothetical protein [Sphingomonas sp. Leaf257]|uniref:hypothetical protein n=1 Tax=Sphingomonas sp. Leaf257 TaxID=1736309 RepID=UPI000A615138|nr:hypothetical protein [Sphingomonas sp. Leaf257]
MQRSSYSTRQSTFTTMIRSIAAAALLLIGAGLAAPASAQFYLKNYDHVGALATDGMPEVLESLPGATSQENDAALIWSMRAALNVAALQCQFEPTLLTDSNYNAILIDHSQELAAAWAILGAYFKRTNTSIRAGQDALDRYGTRIYSRFSTVSAQYEFCRTISSIGRDILFSGRGELGVIAGARFNELRSSLVSRGEQFVPNYPREDDAALPRLEDKCWDRKARWRPRACGANPWARG